MPTVGAVAASSSQSTNLTLLASTTSTASATATGTIPIPVFAQAILQLHVTAVAGTTETLDVYVQTLLPDGATYTDLAHFTQVTTSTGDWWISMATGSTGASVVQDAALAAGSVALLNFGSTWRLKWVISGTSPSYTFTVFASFF